MVQKEWKTVSARIDEDELNALDIYCERKEITQNKAIREMINSELKEILHPETLSKSKGIPKVGKNEFSYDAESDTFDWNIDLGSENYTICEHMSPLFIQGLINSLVDAQKERDSVLKKRKGKVTFPEKITEFKVEK